MSYIAAIIFIIGFSIFVFRGTIQTIYILNDWFFQKK